MNLKDAIMQMAQDGKNSKAWKWDRQEKLSLSKIHSVSHLSLQSYNF